MLSDLCAINVQVVRHVSRFTICEVLFTQDAVRTVNISRSHWQYQMTELKYRRPGEVWGVFQECAVLKYQAFEG